MKHRELECHRRRQTGKQNDCWGLHSAKGKLVCSESEPFQKQRNENKIFSQQKPREWIGPFSVTPCPVPCNYTREPRPGSPARAPACDTAILQRQQECKRLAKTKGMKPPESFTLERSLTGTTGMFLEANGTGEKLKRMKSLTAVTGFRLEALQKRHWSGVWKESWTPRRGVSECRYCWDAWAVSLRGST